MVKLDEKYWTERYLNNKAGWDAGTITRPLKEYIDQLKDPSIRILIPGAGNGYEAEYLHSRGFLNTWVLDISSQPLQNILKRVPDFPADHLLNADFFAHSGQYDLIIEQTFFCALPREMRTAYASKIYELLVPGGKLVGLLFDGEFNNEEPPYGGSREEYLGYFQPYFRIGKMEPCYNSIQPRKGRELFFRLIKNKRS